MRKEEMPGVAAEAMKEAMKYTDAQNRCKTCGAFGSDERGGGGRSDRPARCEFNMYWFPVDEGGYCKHWYDSKEVDWEKQ